MRILLIALFLFACDKSSHIDEQEPVRPSIPTAEPSPIPDQEPTQEPDQEEPAQEPQDQIQVQKKGKYV